MEAINMQTSARPSAPPRGRRAAILFVTRMMPWPLHGGARLRDFNMLQALADSFDVDLLTVGVNQPQVTALCRNVYLPTPFYGDETPWLAAKRWGAALVETMTGPEPMWLTSKTNAALRRAIRERADKGGYDLVIASELSSAAVLLGHAKTPVIYDAHNCEWRLLDRTRREQTGLRRRVLDREVPRLREVERRAVTESQMVFVTAQSDLDELQALAGADLAPHRIIPSTIDLERYAAVRAATPEPMTILVPGKFDWQPNLIGLDWFAADVVPALRARLNGAPFKVVVAGRMTQATQVRLDAVPEITAMRNPDDMLPLFARAALVAVPVLVSSGTRLRIAEGLASKRPIVSTTPGAAGLDAGDAMPWLVADGTEAYADALARVLTDEALSRRIVQDGWAVAQTLDWTSLRAPLAGAIDDVLSRAR